MQINVTRLFLLLVKHIPRWSLINLFAHEDGKELFELRGRKQLEQEGDALLEFPNKGQHIPTEIKKEESIGGLQWHSSFNCIVCNKELFYQFLSCVSCPIIAQVFTDFRFASYS
jgi:hypothetical protein